MGVISTIGEEIQRSTTAWLILFFIFSVFEWVFARPRPSLALWAKSLSFWSIAIPVSAILEIGLGILWHNIGIKPFVELSMTSGVPNFLYTIAAIAVLILYEDFFFYWYHRVQHRWLWRWHSVHHSIRSLNAVNSYHHISEPIFRSLLIMIPASMFVVDANIFIPWVAFALWMQTGLLHSALPINIGPLRVFFGDNRFHRIHHSIEPKHYDRNFGALTTLWDRLFGTAYWPAADEWPETGVTDVSEPKTIRDWLATPLRQPAA